MDKKYFLDALDYYLRKIPYSDRKEIIQDFEGQFQDGLLENKKEKEVAAELGDPKVIADNLLVDYQVDDPDIIQPDTNIFRAILLTIVLTLVNLIFIFGPIVAIIGVYFSFLAVGIAFSLAPFAWIGSIIIGQTSDLLSVFFIVLTVCSLGVLLSIGMIYVGKILYQLIVSYIKLNIRIIKG
ncbi:HAAS signaling domain-containing protein [Aquibacillus saliphilus]|uniref:HAAS signaling domain-containing protein n=1 Tax=Aquibacillus saliphilus TaxID=1909422 RepID=UPI001CEFEA85|nr:DUF1700 domain-containing protein [Aquibacillus saliphilus]